MDPISLIETALAAGAGLAVRDTVSAAVKDAYATLKAAVKRRFADRPDAEMVVAEHERAPETWRARLRAELLEAGADQDPEVVTAAEAMMTLLDEAGSRAGKYTVEVRGSQGVQVGDGNSQSNVFYAPPGG